MKHSLGIFILIGLIFCPIVGFAAVEEKANIPSSSMTPQVNVLQPPSGVSASSKISSGDTAWVLISAALVMLMTPGLALFYGGMVRTKNVLGTIMQSFIALGIITIQWDFLGYSLPFGPDIGHVIGSLQWAGLRGVGLDPNPDYAATVPHQAFMIFQMMFAVIN